MNRRNPRISGARLVAYDVLRDVTERDAYANLALPAKIRAAGLDRRDAGLAVELAAGTLRERGRYDRIIELAAGRQSDKIDSKTLNVLRLGVHQLLSMRIPQHAALHETVELQRRVAGARAVGFVNGVLRTVSRSDAKSWDQRIVEGVENEDERLAILTSHPLWMVRAFRATLSREGRSQEVADLLRANNSAPRVNLAAPDESSARELATRNEEFEFDLIGPSPVGLELVSGDPTAAIAAQGSLSGVLRVQDQGSQLVALALARATRSGESEQRRNEKWLDLCAGPGGKSALLGAEAQRVGATLRANEISEHRARLVRKATEHMRDVVEVVSHDGRSHEAFGDSNETFDRILIDAPCSGIGALRRRPEARWRKHASDLPELVALQADLLNSAAEHLAPGGLLAYVTCSSHLAETELQIKRFAREFPHLTQRNAREVLSALARTPLDFGEPHSMNAQLWPHRHGTDAMFLALFEYPVGSRSE